MRGDELPAELQRREERLAKIAAAKARLEARQADEDRQKGRTPDDGRKGRGTKPFARDFGVPPDDAQDNFTDPESRIMKTSYGFDQCYNGQLAVDEASQLIVATGLTNCAADNAELLPADRSGAHATLAARSRLKCWPMRAIAARRRFRRWRRAWPISCIQRHRSCGGNNRGGAHGVTRPKDDCSVLIVEDDPDLREMMCLLLTLEGFTPVATRDGVEALERLRSHEVQPDVIVLDLMMPRMSGAQFMRELARDPAVPSIPVVVLTAVPPEQITGEAAAVLRKPCDYDALLAAVRTHSE